MIGTILHDRWRVLTELGRGGMGEVFLAEHIALGRNEALKILSPSIATDPQFVSRFRREARAVNRLRHPNIVAIYDFGQLPDGRFYLAMEYAEGDSVFRLLRQYERLDVPRALHLLGQLAYAVHHAHSRGVVHRDLKPGNLIVGGDDDTLKVLDFGMAKIVAPDVADSTPLSMGSVIWGTPRYMSPERVMGVGNDPRSDLYAIGCLAFELVVGTTPFAGTPQEIIHSHVTEPPPVPSARQRGIPGELDAVILRLLAKEPDDRYQTAAELYAALRKVPGYPEPRTEARRRFVPIQRRPATLEPERPRAATEPGNARGALREVAEALQDLGVDDARLVSGIAYLADHERSLARLEAAQDALEHEAAAVRETVGDREVSLRFALGELELMKSDDTAKLRELEARLGAATKDGDRLRAIEAGIAQVAQLRAGALDKLKSAYEALERVVEELLTHGDETYDAVRQRFVAARARRQPR
jgi:hypothetical protein